MSSCLLDPEQFVGMRGDVEPHADDPFSHTFQGLVVGVRRGFLQVRDAEDDVYEVEVAQFTPAMSIVGRRPSVSKEGGV